MNIVNDSIIFSYDEWLSSDILVGIDHELGLCESGLVEEDLWIRDTHTQRRFISSGKTREILSILSEYHEMY